MCCILGFVVLLVLTHSHLYDAISTTSNTGVRQVDFVKLGLFLGTTLFFSCPNFSGKKVAFLSQITVLSEAWTVGTLANAYDAFRLYSYQLG